MDHLLYYCVSVVSHTHDGDNTRQQCPKKAVAADEQRYLREVEDDTAFNNHVQQYESIDAGMDTLRNVIRRAKRQLRNRHIQEVKIQKLGEVTLKHVGSSLIKKTHQLNDVARIARNCIISNKCPARFKEVFGGCAEAFSVIPGNISIQIRNGQRKVIPSDRNIRPSYVKWFTKHRKKNQG